MAIYIQYSFFNTSYINIFNMSYIILLRVEINYLLININ